MIIENRVAKAQPKDQFSGRTRIGIQYSQDFQEKASWEKS